MSPQRKKIIVVGISGATCSGKTTVAKELNKLLPNSKIFCQDDYFFPVDDSRHTWIPELDHINFDIISSLDMEKMVLDVKQHMKSKTNNTITETPMPEYDKQRNLLQINDCHVVIVEGFCIFNYRPLAELCDLKYFFTLDFEECHRRREKRVYEPPDCPGYFDKCAWPEHLKQKEEVKREFNDVVYFDGNNSKQSEAIIRDICSILCTT
ncbi:nicotinamide riboside kinase 1 [Anthonomus grandis grandis]|uniref:nicotinamide riboside kinase 1 n=1 Tax=Anthonomus grandis grandis TaxID=2921223 RepID=UPI002166B7B9|nr:nicotinamide riboside kinase 1 [Anthonomus grandis grandis]